MKPILFPTIHNNELAHRQVKQLMKQQRLLNIRLDEAFASVSSTAVTGLHYRLTPDTWNWIVNYLNTGDYEDFGIFPSETATLTSSFQTDNLKQLIEKGCNIARIPFLRASEAYIKLRGLFRFGKLFFSIKRDEAFTDYLSSKGL